MYPFSIFADYRHFADSERKNREKGREMPWHFRIDVRVKRECPSRRTIGRGCVAYATSLSGCVAYATSLNCSRSEGK